MSSAICFNSDQSKILSSGKVILNHCIFGWPKIDDKICDGILIFTVAEQSFDFDFVKIEKIAWKECCGQTKSKESVVMFTVGLDIT